MKAICVKIDGDRSDPHSFYEVDFGDVRKIEIEKIKGNKLPVYYTKDGKYVPILSLEHHLEVLFDLGFDELHPSNVVNMEHVKHIKKHGFGYLAYFEDGTTADVSRENSKRYPHLIITD